MLFSQQNGGLQGIVKDAGNKEVLSGVTVFVESLKKGTSTDINGHYKLSLPEGSYNITFSFIGYVSETKHINIHICPKYSKRLSYYPISKRLESQYTRS